MNARRGQSKTLTKRAGVPPGYQPTLPGAAHLDVVQARRYELVDAAGHVRGGLGFTDDGDPMLLLSEGPKLTMRARLTLDQKDGPMLLLGDAKGRVRMKLAVHNDQPLAGIVVCDARQKPRILLGINEKGVTQAALRDTTGRKVELLKRFAPRKSKGVPPPLVALARAGKKRQFIEAMAAAIDGYDWRLGEGVYNWARTRLAKEGRRRE